MKSQKYSPLSRHEPEPGVGASFLTKSKSRRWWSLSLALCISTVIILFSLLQFSVPHDLRPAFDTQQDFAYTDYQEQMKSEVRPLPKEREELLRQLLSNANSSGHHRSTPACREPVQKVGFMKTHKTASSTVQNILMRYGRQHTWNFVMMKDGNHLGPPGKQYVLNKPFQSSWVQNVPWSSMTADQGYNALVFHTMWNQKEVESLLGEGARYFTILRDPVDQFESMYNYVHFEQKFGGLGLEEFVEHYLGGPGGSLSVRRVNGYLGRNQQFWDLGYAPSDLDTLGKVKARIQEISRNFHLVMIAEDFTSSLVLLSDLLCWPLKDMSSLKLNARRKSEKDQLSPRAKSLLKEWLWADGLLYSYFKHVLEQRKLDYGLDKLKEKVSSLEAVNREVKDQCVTATMQNTDALDPDFQPWSKDVLGFQVNKHLPWCKYYAISENKFIDYLRELQLDRWLDWTMERDQEQEDMDQDSDKSDELRE